MIRTIRDLFRIIRSGFSCRRACFMLVSAASALSIAAQAKPSTKEIKFEKENLELSYLHEVNKKFIKKIIKVELAKSPEQHAQGLMFRKQLKSDEGMLFIFADEQIREFWMKNTFINLDIGYFDKNKKLIDIKQMKAVPSIISKDLPVYSSKHPAMFALEVPWGWFEKNKIKEGAVFSCRCKLRTSVQSQ